MRPNWTSLFQLRLSPPRNKGGLTRSQKTEISNFNLVDLYNTVARYTGTSDDLNTHSRLYGQPLFSSLYLRILVVTLSVKDS